MKSLRSGFDERAASSADCVRKEVNRDVTASSSGCDGELRAAFAAATAASGTTRWNDNQMNGEIDVSTLGDASCEGAS